MMEQLFRTVLKEEQEMASHDFIRVFFFVKTSSILGRIKAFSLTNGKKPNKKIFAFYIKIIPVILQTPPMNSPASSLEAI